MNRDLCVLSSYRSNSVVKWHCLLTSPVFIFPDLECNLTFFAWFWSQDCILFRFSGQVYLTLSLLWWHCSLIDYQFSIFARWHSCWWPSTAETSWVFGRSPWNTSFHFVWYLTTFWFYPVLFRGDCGYIPSVLAIQFPSQHQWKLLLFGFLLQVSTLIFLY